MKVFVHIAEVHGEMYNILRKGKVKFFFYKTDNIPRFKKSEQNNGITTYNDNLLSFQDLD